MISNTYKFKRQFFYHLIQNEYEFKIVADELGYEKDFLMQILEGKIDISKNELKNILEVINLTEKDLIEDNFFKNQNETHLKSAFNKFFDEFEKK